MSGSFSFVHAADLHLDSQFKGLEQAALRSGDVPEQVLRRLRDCTFEAFGRIVDLCLERRVDFLLLAGDVYDAADKSLRAQIRFRDELARLAGSGISAFVVHGNHDHCSGWRAGLEYPDSVHFFSDREVESRPYLRGGREIARIYGVSYPRQAVFEDYSARFKRDQDSPFAVALLHCNVGGQEGHENYSPCRLSDLRARGFDYWALGHVHSRAVLSSGRPWVAYPGCPQGRSPREAGERGCFIVNVSGGGNVSQEFIPVEAVRWEAVNTSIEGLYSDQDLLDKLAEDLLERREKAGGKPLVARVNLTGRGLLHKNLARPSYLENLAGELRSRLAGDEESFILLESLRAATGAGADLAGLAASDTLLGDLLTLAGKALTEQELREELRRSLAVLVEHPRAGKYLAAPGEAELDELLERAGNLAVDLLLESDE